MINYFKKIVSLFLLMTFVLSQLNAQDLWADLKQCNAKILHSGDIDLRMDVNIFESDVLIDEAIIDYQHHDNYKYIKMFDKTYVLENDIALTLNESKKKIHVERLQNIDSLLNSLQVSNQWILEMKDKTEIDFVKEDHINHYTIRNIYNREVLVEISMNTSNWKIIQVVNFPKEIQFGQKQKEIKVVMIYHYETKMNNIVLNDIYPNGNINKDPIGKFKNYQVSHITSNQRNQ